MKPSNQIILGAGLLAVITTARAQYTPPAPNGCKETVLHAVACHNDSQAYWGASHQWRDTHLSISQTLVEQDPAQSLKCKTPDFVKIDGLFTDRVPLGDNRVIIGRTTTGSFNESTQTLSVVFADSQYLVTGLGEISLKIGQSSQADVSFVALDPMEDSGVQHAPLECKSNL